MNNLLTLFPSTSQNSMPLLIALHGNLSSAEASLDYWRPAVSAGWMLAMPQSTRTDENGEFIWNRPGYNEWPVEEIQRHSDNLINQYSIDADNIVIAGFSMGGGLAAWMTLHGYINVRGFILVAPYLPYEYVEAPTMDVVNAEKLRGYVIVGEQDQPLCEFSGLFRERLMKKNVPCKLVTYPNLDHEYPPDFESALPQALEFVRRGE
jgi:dienelactone hydrolase